jgi:adenylate cyclase
MRSIQRTMAERAARLIRDDPDVAATALEMGVIDRRWLDEPGERPITTSTPVEVLRRLMEKAVEQRPSRLSSLGLTALDLLSSADGETGTQATVTVVFTDLEGFTAYTAAHGDAAATALLQRHHRAVGPVVRTMAGRLVKRLGDGLLLCFADAEQAVLAAVELLDTAPEPLTLRCGAHSGEALVTKRDVMGHVVNVAARVTELAKGGEVLVTTAVREAAGDVPGIAFGRARARRLKGVSEKVPVCPVTAVS